MKWLIALLLYLTLLAPSVAQSSASHQADADSHVTVHVIRHRWHTGIAIPAEHLDPSLGFLAAHFHAPQYYEIGWGDDAFYRHDDNLWLRARAMLWPTRAALHVVGMPRHPADFPHTDIQALCLNQRQLAQLQQSMASYFIVNRHGELAAGDPGLYGDSYFFPARGRFWLGNTCNTWTAKRLQHAGLPLRPFLTLTADQVLRQLRRSEQIGACRDPLQPQ